MSLNHPYRTCGAAGGCRRQGNRSGYCCFYLVGVQSDLAHPVKAIFVLALVAIRHVAMV
jgi:hypothetical protein